MNRLMMLLSMSFLCEPNPGDAGASAGGLGNPAPAPAVVDPNAAPPVVTDPANPAPPSSGLDFIPEAFRGSDWATKYKTPEDFFKGVDNLAKMVGKKEIVEGVKVPGADATPEELNAFYASIGRPEAADKYALPEDVQAHEGLDLATEKKAISEIAFKHGLSQKQAEGIFKDYIDSVNQKFTQSEAKVKESFDQAVVSAFGNDFKESLGLAKRGAKALGIANKLDSEGLSANPTVLQLCAELGKLVGEDTLENGSAKGKESFLEEAVRLQKSAEYANGDKVTHAKVAELYKKAYPN